MKNALCLKVDSIGIDGIMINGYKVTGGTGGKFSASTDEFRIDFIAETRNGGLYTKVVSYLNKSNNRFYQSPRFTIKFTRTAQELGFNLLLKNYLWDYKDNNPAIESYAWGIKPYIEKCMSLGISY